MTIDHPGHDAIMAWIDEELGANEAARVARHVAGCTACRERAQAFRGTSAELRGWTTGPLPGGLTQPPVATPVSWKAWRWGIAAAALVAIAAGATWWPSICVVRCEPAGIEGRRRPDAAGASAQPIPGARHRGVVEIVEFIDWQCPSCAAAYAAYKPILDRYVASGTVTFVAKDYPLNPDCNVHVPTRVHGAACDAAVAVRLARERGQADAMISQLFAHQPEQTPAMVQSLARNLLGVDADEWSRESARLLADIRRDTDEGAATNIRFTPTFYINGRLAQAEDGRWLSPDAFETAIRRMIESGSGAAPASQR